MWGSDDMLARRPASTLARGLRMQLPRSADESWRPGRRRVGHCAACGAAVLADDEHVVGARGLFHGACAPTGTPAALRS